MTSNSMILVAEDSDEDFAAFTRIMQNLGCVYPIHRVCDGDEALDYLYRTGIYTDPSASPRPSVILLDLNMPGTDGRDVIQQVKQDEDLKSIPIVVLTTSSNSRDVNICYRYGINSYLIKPIGLQALKQTIQDFFRYWLELNILPHTETT
ncbi:MAG: response regulator [Scytolyngbya sp. HA4215-MV1]|nr:response regulator [Scytolyngbya sp. HA4215-MV1]